MRVDGEKGGRGMGNGAMWRGMGEVGMGDEGESWRRVCQMVEEVYEGRQARKQRDTELMRSK